MGMKAKFYSSKKAVRADRLNLIEALKDRREAERQAKYTKAEIQQAVADEVSQVIIPALQAKLEENKSVFRSEVGLGPGLHGSMNVRRTDHSVILDAGVPYVKILDTGSGPREVSDVEREYLEEWVLHKDLTDDPDHAKMVAKRIADKIELVGSAEHPFIKEVLDATRPDMEKIVGEKFRFIVRSGNGPT